MEFIFCIAPAAILGFALAIALGLATAARVHRAIRTSPRDPAHDETGSDQVPALRRVAFAAARRTATATLVVAAALLFVDVAAVPVALLVGAVLSISAAIGAVCGDEAIQQLGLSPDAGAAMARFAGAILVACLVAAPGIVWGMDPSWGLVGPGVAMVFALVLNVCGVIAGTASVDVYRSTRDCLAGLADPALFSPQLRVVRAACLGMASASATLLAACAWVLAPLLRRA